MFPTTVCTPIESCSATPRESPPNPALPHVGSWSISYVCPVSKTQDNRTEKSHGAATGRRALCGSRVAAVHRARPPTLRARSATERKPEPAAGLGSVDASSPKHRACAVRRVWSPPQPAEAPPPDASSQKHRACAAQRAWTPQQPAEAPLPETHPSTCRVSAVAGPPDPHAHRKRLQAPRHAAPVQIHCAQPLGAQPHAEGARRQAAHRAPRCRAPRVAPAEGTQHAASAVAAPPRPAGRRPAAAPAEPRRPAPRPRTARARMSCGSRTAPHSRYARRSNGTDRRRDGPR